MRRILGRTLALTLAVAVVVAGGWVLWRRGAPGTPEVAGVAGAPGGGDKDRDGGADLVAVVERRDIDFQVDVTGDVTPDFRLDVRPEVGGKVKRLHVVAGDKVKKGELLVEIDDTDLQTERLTVATEIDGAKLGMEKTRRNFERARELFESKLVSGEVFDNISLDFELAKNGLARAERRLATVDDKLAKTRIHAAIDGTVLNVEVIEGQVVVAAASVNSGTLLLSVADLTRLLVSTHVNQVDISHLAAGQEVAIASESLGDAKMGARISFIAPVATLKNGVKGFRVDALIERADARLRPGMTVKLVIPVARVEEAVAVPVAAIFRGEGDERVVYVRRQGETRRQPVKVGVTNFEYAEIQDGVAPGEEILLAEPRGLPASPAAAAPGRKS